MFSTFGRIHRYLFLHCILAPVKASVKSVLILATILICCKYVLYDVFPIVRRGIILVTKKPPFYSFYPNQEPRESKQSYRGSQRHCIIDVWHWDLSSAYQVALLTFIFRVRNDAKRGKRGNFKLPHQAVWLAGSVKCMVGHQMSRGSVLTFSAGNATS